MHSLGHILPVIWFIAVCASLQALLQLCRNKFICRKLKVIQIITVYRHTNRFCLQEVSTDLFSHWGRGQFCIYEENSFCLLDKWECYSLSHIQLCDPMDSGGGARQTPLSPGILQARILEWAAIPFSRGSPQPRDWIWVPCIAGRFFTVWTTWKASRWAYALVFGFTFGFTFNQLQHFLCSLRN